ncbi:hypothetical protein VTN49DRAFT_4462 [Thermomyces lanuginosus]|uniref:uncharacterized protein n=1 Tax=Thermomyces lanuginosus TaxID=5541 RepID=UPI0037426184
MSARQNSCMNFATTDKPGVAPHSVAHRALGCGEGTFLTGGANLSTLASTVHLSEGYSRRVIISRSAVLGDERVQSAGTAGNTVPTAGSIQTAPWVVGRDTPPSPSASDELKRPQVFCAERYPR